MPTYEYVCKSCGHRFEVVRSMRDEPLTVCPECGGELRKVFAPPAIAFKGSGFYATDHGKKSKRPSSSEKTPEKADKKEAKDSGSTESGASSSGESKSETSSPKEATTT